MPPALRSVSLEADNAPVLRALPAPLYVMTDRHRAATPLPAVLQTAVRGGARWIRVREPDLELSAYTALCHLLIDAVDNARVTWSVRPSAYLLMRSAWPELRIGVHLTSTDAPWGADDADILLGRSIHVHIPVRMSGRAGVGAADSSRPDVEPPAAQDERVDYRLLAPVFQTACKPDVVPIGITAITRLTSRAGAPVIALGGVTVENAAECLRAGAAAVAVCGGVMESDSPEQTVAAYLNQMQKTRGRDHLTPPPCYFDSRLNA